MTQQEIFNYLKNLNIDINEGKHPFAEEFLIVQKFGDETLVKCFEHLLLLLILDLETIKKFNIEDYSYYVKKLKAPDISFWGQKFEMSWYSMLISKLKYKGENLRRGKAGEEADFVFEYKGKKISIETTSVVYELTSEMNNPIIKIKSAIGDKEIKKYATKDCCLIIDFSNLSFYRKIKRNFSTTISELTKSLESKFGMILFQEAFHIRNNENPKYVTQVYDWKNIEANSGLVQFCEDNFSPTIYTDVDKVYFRVG